jgi:hypothetical protein
LHRQPLTQKFFQSHFPLILMLDAQAVQPVNFSAAFVAKPRINSIKLK